MKEVSMESLQLNPYSLIAKDWMLITAGTEENGFNTMTASWGHLGSLWANGGGSPTAICYLRPQRYTKEFLDREPLYSLSFFPETCREKLAYLGSHSGRDGDKLTQTGLTPVFAEGYTYFAEAKLVLVCEKLYRAPIVPEGFFDESLRESMYPGKDYHDMYIGKIVKVLVNE